MVKGYVGGGCHSDDWPVHKKKAPGGQEPGDYWRRAHSQEWLCHRGLDAEGAAAAAGALDVGVVELEAGTFEGFDVVNFHALEIHRTHLVHGDFQAVEIDDFVGIVGLVFKCHVVLETGTSAANNGNPQSNRHRGLHGHDFLDLSSGNRRQINHNK